MNKENSPPKNNIKNLKGTTYVSSFSGTTDVNAPQSDPRTIPATIDNGP
jgi:hypothetical protein